MKVVVSTWEKWENGHRDVIVLEHHYNNFDTHEKNYNDMTNDTQAVIRAKAWEHVLECFDWHKVCDGQI